MLYPKSNDLAKMSRATLAGAVGMFVLILCVLTHLAYGKNTSNSSGLTIDQLRFGPTFQQLDKDTNAGNLTASDVNNAHNACNQLKNSGAPMFMFHLCSSMSR
jgi:hypothetical protein